MKRIVFTVLTILISVASAQAQEKTETKLDDHLTALEPFIGTWEGTFSGEGAPPETIKDIVTYEIILNGKAVRAEHSVGGAYGGITIYYWDSLTERIRMWYFTNSGSYSEGDMQVDNGKYIFTAYHYGGNTSAWKAEAEMSGEDAFVSSALYYQSGKWVAGHSLSYVRKN